MGKGGPLTVIDWPDNLSSALDQFTHSLRLCTADYEIIGFNYGRNSRLAALDFARTCG